MFKRVADWFYMTPQERVGSAVLMILLLVVILGKTVVAVYNSSKDQETAENFIAALQLPEQTNASKSTGSYKTKSMNDRSDVEVIEEFYVFNPNHASESELQTLGLPKDLSRRVIAYKESGGVFYKPEDVLRIYGMDTTWWKTAKRFMTFSLISDDVPKAPSLEYQHFDPNTLSYQDAKSMGFSEWQFEQLKAYRSRKPLTEPEDINLVYGLDPYLLSQLVPYVRIDSRFREHINLNEADTTRLKHMDGVGSYFAKQIVGLRDMLGAFPSHDVLWAIPKMDSLRFYSIRSQSVCEAESYIQLSINKDDVETLASHPFISFSLAREIVEFRENFRPFISVDELKELSLFPINRKHTILPYIIID